MSSIGSVSSSTASKFTGLASGVDTDKLVEGMLGVQNARVTALTAQQDRYTLLQTTYKALQASVLDLQTQAARLGRSSGSVFDGRKATSSDETIVKAAAGSSAVAGTYTFKVTNLAAAHQIASGGIAETTTLLKTGTLQLKVGDGATTTVTLDSSNNTLQGLANAINKSGADVTASIINDGSSGGAANRLMLTSKKTGLSNDIEITNNLTGGTGVAIDLDPAARTIQSGEDAEVVLGSGASAITVKNASNTVDGVIGGVTLNLLAANTDKTITVTVANDVSGAKSAIQGMVDSYNSVIEFIDARDSYDGETKEAGTLLGSGLVGDLQNQMSRALSSVVSGVNGQMNRLSAIGVTLNDKGRLTIDSAKLDSALSGGISGVSMGDVPSLFAMSGNSTNTGITFLTGSSKTQATSSAMKVNITQAAEQASLTADNALVAPVTITGANNTLSLTLFNRTATITLAEGTYDATSLAKELQGKINSNADLGGNQVTVGVDAGKLKVSTVTYGGAAKVTFNSGTALADLGITAGQTDAGLDVRGYFTVNGKDELATGSGQTLIANSGNTTTDGLQLKVTLTAAQLQADGATPEGELSIIRGLGAGLDSVLQKFTDSTNGRFVQTDKGYQSSLDEVKESITRQNTLIDAKREALVVKFAAMEAAVSKLKSTGDSLAAMLASSSSS